MATQILYLLTSRTSSAQRSHFALWIPSTANPKKGTSIEVLGTPLTGYGLEFKRNYSLDGHTGQGCSIIPIGEVDTVNVAGSTDGSDDGAPTTTDCVPRGNIERVASQMLPPGVCESVFGPVNDTTNRRCQEWTMEYIRKLVAKGYIGEKAIHIVQSKRDPTTHGVGLRPVGMSDH